MKNSRKNVLTSLFLCALILTAVSACGQETAETQSPETTQPETETAAAPETEAATEEERYAKPETADLGGYTLTIATSPWVNCDKMILPDALNGELVNDTLYTHMKDLGDAYNAGFALSLFNNEQEVTKTVQKSALAGSNDFGLSYNHDNQTVANALKGCFIDLRHNGSFDFSAPWWTDTADSFTIDGKMYFASNYLTYSGIYCGFVLCYNKDIADNLDLEIPYEDIFAGNWYMSDLIPLAKEAYRDLNGDGKMSPEDDAYGFTTSELGMVNYQVSLGTTILSKSDEGLLIFNPDTARFQTVFEKFENLMEYGFTADDNISYGATYFVKNNVLFDFIQIRVIDEQMRDTQIRYGFLPAPKLDESQEKYISGAFDIFWAIPQPAAEEVDNISMLLEATAYNCYYDILPLVYESTLQVKFSDSQLDAKTFDIIRDSIYVDVGYAFNEQSSKLGGLVYGLSRQKSETLQSTIEKSLESIEKALNKINGKYLEME